VVQSSLTAIASRGPIRWVLGIKGPTIGTDVQAKAVPLILLCLAVVAGFAQALKWAVVEAGLIALVRMYVVDHSSAHHLGRGFPEMPSAQRVQ
jgi:hypothetical protein